MGNYRNYQFNIRMNANSHFHSPFTFANSTAHRIFIFANLQNKIYMITFAHQ